MPPAACVGAAVLRLVGLEVMVSALADSRSGDMSPREERDPNAFVVTCLLLTQCGCSYDSPDGMMSHFG